MTSRISVTSTLRMQQALEVEGLTASQLATVGGLSLTSVRYWIKQLRRVNPSPIYVSGWACDASGRVHVAEWRWGRRADVPRPTPVSAAERMRRMRSAKTTKEKS